MRVESGSYLISYFDANGDRQEVNAETTDRDAAEQIARKLETEVALRKRGVIDPRRRSDIARGPSAHTGALGGLPVLPDHQGTDATARP